ncbi:hypothetical protein PSN45_002217 [Yamadazyma tenuis]|nr:hypothetical protein PSN45_002217 [Yamadazyma tenuis]
MSGSSRQLLRDLSAVLDSWESGIADYSNRIKTSDLFRSITAFHDKHNTLQAIQSSTNLHNKLHEFHTNYIGPNADLPREILFVEILTEISPVLSKEEAEVWLKTYLRPAVDSANFDLEFVSKCRYFIIKLADCQPYEDQALRERRLDIAVAVINRVFDLYLGPDPQVLEFIGLSVRDEDKNTQEFSERLRFVKRNSMEILYNFALVHPTTFGDIANSRFIIAHYRLAVLALLSMVLNSRSSNLHALANTDLFANLFKCLSFDFSEEVLASGLSLLVMFVPLVSDRMGEYVSDLMIIYTRVVIWYSFSISIGERAAILKEQYSRAKQGWDMALPTGEESKTILDSSYLVTIIYGFFPYSLSLFADSPLRYLQENPPKFVEGQFLLVINDLITSNISPKEETVLNYIASFTKSYLKSFILHPNFLKMDRLSVEYEKRNPTRWLIEDKQDDSLGVEEIMLGCLALNPVLGFFVPDAISPSMVDVRLEDEPKTKLNGDGSAPMSRASSIGSPLYFNFSNQSLIPNLSLSSLNRKMSVIPTNLAIEGKKQGEINFKEINYDGEKPVENASGRDRQGSDPLHNLFSTHEKLYNPKSSDSTDTQSVRTLDVHSLLGDKVKTSRTQSCVASVDSSKETVFSSGGSLHNMPEGELKKNASGTIVDFYQRELLLMKNEIEFSSYMKHLNKFQYIKLKLQMNRMRKEGELPSSSREYMNTKLKYEGLLEERNTLRESYNDLKEALESSLKNSKRERDFLVSKFSNLDASNSETCKHLKHIEATNHELMVQVDELTKQVLPAKDEEIFNLHNQFKDLTTEYSILEKEMENLTIQHNSSMNNGHDDSPHKVNHVEKEIHDLKTEILQLSEKNEFLVQQLEKLKSKNTDLQRQHDTRILANKKEVAYQVNALSSQYEKKIQELFATILKYETLVEDKNLKIAQLSSSRPISIPGSVSMVSDTRGSQSHPSAIPTTNGQQQGNPMDVYTFNNRNNSSSSSESLGTSAQLPFNTPPLRTPVTMDGKGYFPTTNQNAPIIKGRGGYQKRSKKHM